MALTPMWPFCPMPGHTKDSKLAVDINAFGDGYVHRSTRGLNPIRPAYGVTFTFNGDAEMALSNGEIDALVADLPTSFAVANELRNGLMVGQLPSAADDVELLGIVLDKGSPLTRCVSWAIDTLRGDGTLAKLEHRWLNDAGKASVLT